eukprot:TRINITY_DN21039_c0_g1_i2.p1 TRINITY_DN21039_c0_g1~~TRINITY_DN21039_c0_g1_i2.p1  ORF type:complete len:610 (+),score=102.74 TRINITY_DN21039_c0_g1_i2:60-1832(+)
MDDNDLQHQASTLSDGSKIEGQGDESEDSECYEGYKADILPVQDLVKDAKNVAMQMGQVGENMTSGAEVWKYIHAIAAVKWKHKQTFDSAISALIVFDVCLVIVLAEVGQDEDQSKEQTLTLKILTLLLSLAFGYEMVVRCCDYLVQTKMPPFLFILEATVVVTSSIDAVWAIGGGEGSLAFVLTVRGFRLIRFVGLVASKLRAVGLVNEAVKMSAKPLFFVAVVILLMLLTFGTALAIQTPDLAKSVPELKDDMLKHFGSTQTCTKTIIIAIWSSGEIGEVLRKMFQYNDCQFFIWMFMGMVFMTALTSSSLVVGVFSSSIIMTKGGDRLKTCQELFRKAQRLVNELEDTFWSEGIDPAVNIVTEKDVQKVWTKMTTWTKNKYNELISEKEAMDCFDELSEIGSVRAEEFCGVIFKRITMTKTVEVMALDFQQQQVHYDTVTYGHDLQEEMKLNQRRCWHLKERLEEISQLASAAAKDLTEMQKLEDELHERQREIALLQQENKPLDAKDLPPTLEELSEQAQIDQQLKAIEELIDDMGKHTGEEVQTSCVELLAEDLVEQLRYVLREELKQTHRDDSRPRPKALGVPL